MNAESKTQQIINLIKEGETNIKTIAEKVSCRVAMVYAVRSANFPYLVRKYKKAKAKAKAKVKAKAIEEVREAAGKLTEKFLEDTAVNHPAHYTVGGIETYDFIVAKKLSYELGNVVKYITRADYKGNKLRDLQKARWYLDAAIKQEEA